MSLRGKLRRLEKVARGKLASFELADGSRYLFEPGEVGPEIFVHGGCCLTADYKGEARPDPPEILQAVAKAKDPRAALEQLYTRGATPFTAYDIEALAERGEFVHRSFLAGHTYEESIGHFAKKNADKE